jgi:hypothetical protein
MEKSRTTTRKRTPKAERKDDPQDSGKTIEDHFYRCPACGVLVDGWDRKEMQLHHQHVLFPRPFDLRQAGPKEQIHRVGPR